MQEQNYSIWDFKKVTGTEYTIYYNDFLVITRITTNSRNYEARSSWNQIDTLTIPSEYTPISVISTISNNVNVNVSIISSGKVMYHNRSSSTVTAQLDATLIYPRKDVLP